MIEAMGRFNEELRAAGILLAADGLKPSSQGKRIAFDGPGRTVIDGPFAETRELVAGFWLWEVKDMDEAVAWVKRCPNPMPGPSEIEIRPLYELADLLGEDHGKRRRRGESHPCPPRVSHPHDSIPASERVPVFAEFEREVLRERVRLGIARARKEGRPHGRPRTASLKAGTMFEGSRPSG